MEFEKSSFYDLIEENKIVIFTKRGCKVTCHVKQVFKEICAYYKEIDLFIDRYARWYTPALIQITGSSRVPQIFINGQYTGGACAIVNLYMTGELQRLLYFAPPIRNRCQSSMSSESLSSCSVSSEPPPTIEISSNHIYSRTQLKARDGKGNPKTKSSKKKSKSKRF